MQQTMQTAQLSAEEIGRLGQEIYDRELRQRLEPEHIGEFAVINVVNGDYVVDPDEEKALDQAIARSPGEVFYIVRVGFPAVDSIGTVPLE